MRNIAKTHGLQHLVQTEQRAKISPQFVWPKHQAYNFHLFSRGGFYFENWKIQSKFFKIYTLGSESKQYLLTLASLLACAGSVEEFTFLRVNRKFHDPCEVLARSWRAKTSLLLLPWINSVLRLKYAEPTKFTAFKTGCEGAKKLQQKNFVLWRIKETPTPKKFFHRSKETPVLKNWT